MTNTPTDKKWHPAIIQRAKELRQPLTPQEQKLWQRLRSRQLYNLKFRRQHPIGPFVVDFFCHQHQLVIEIDGYHHAEPDQRRYDEARTAWLEEEQGLRVIRFANREVDTNIEGVLQEITGACGVELAS